MSGRVFLQQVLRVCLFAITGLALVASRSSAQFPEDALRFATPGVGVGARSLGMGNAYTGVASDFTALYWNPAGLAQLRHNEFTLGLSHLNYGNSSTFFGSQQSFSNNATRLNSIGMAFPVEVRRGNLVFALGYSRNSDFTTGLSFNGFNPVSSIIQTYAANGALAPSDLSSNLAWQLFLANLDSTDRFESPIINRITQDGRVTEGGGINNWALGGAIDIAANLSAGVTLTYQSGSYTYDRSYREIDSRNVYDMFPFDFDELTIDEYVKSELDGFNARFGLLYRVPERFRFGVTVQTPTTYRVREDFGTMARSYFDNGDIQPTDGPFETVGRGEYDVVTPWVFSAGASIMVRDLVLSGDVEFTDWSQLEFADANADIIALNKDIKEIFRATLNLRAGVEYDVKEIGLRLRGGFIYSPSPYEGDPSSFDRKYITAGLGLLLTESTMIDVAYARGFWNTFRTNYDRTSRVDEKITTNNVILTFSYRF
jgi:long-subunit fatty acid transport protein